MSAESMIPSESSVSLPRHWAFAAVAAVDSLRFVLQDANLVLPTVFMVDQLAAEFEADPLIQSDPQQRAIWAQLRARIAPHLADELRAFVSGMSEG